MTEQVGMSMSLEVIPQAPAGLAEDAETGVRVRVLPQDVEIFVRPGETILEAGLRSGLALANSCREGICGTCRIRKLSGEVDMREQSALFDDEIEAGDILACCSRPLTPLVVECP